MTSFYDFVDLREKIFGNEYLNIKKGDED